MKQHRLAAAVALVGLVLAGCDSQTSEVELKSPAQKASYGIGLNMGKSLSQEGMDDLAAGHYTDVDDAGLDALIADLGDAASASLQDSAARRTGH